MDADVKSESRDLQQPNQRQLEARRFPPSREEITAALRSTAVSPRLCSKYGIPPEILTGARESSSRYSYSPNIFYRRIIEYLYPAGTRVLLLDPLADEKNPPVKPGDEGTVECFDDAPNFKVNWDNGSRIGLLTEVDRFSCSPAT